MATTTQTASKNNPQSSGSVEDARATRGAKFVGTVTSAKMHKTATVVWDRTFFIKKYERYERRRTKIHAHNPETIDAKKGDIVVIEETRPLSKTKHFIITKVLGKDIDYTLKEEAKSIDDKTAQQERTVRQQRREQAKRRDDELRGADSVSKDAENKE